MNPRTVILFICLPALLIILFVCDMMVGSVEYSLSTIWLAVTGDADTTTTRIVCDIRLHKAIVALFVGAALSVSGAQMQTVFRNPLAGPYVLGITSGASLGVALAILGAPMLGVMSSGLFASLGIAGAAWLGSAIVLVVIAIVGVRVKDILVILILGIMFSSGVSAIVQVLQYMSHEDALKSFVVWTMGSLSDTTTIELYILIISVIIGLILSFITIKPLNLLLMGERYASTMGVNILRSRGLIFLSTVLLAGTVTAFCGPIGFIGLAVPHVARAIFSEADHRIVLPASALTGACSMLLCDIVSKQFVLPINTITALLGIPIVIWVVIGKSTPKRL